ncbi:hypothetical protein EOPP23_00495 [Endozoicomonas sp. OPT23]|uniref:hypothetical protein n=1 Tax=Endozoicomonas sp. OPT23 TaxID=2072845 RepID=UPI00129AC178|nr:hypothetical protein [Endozoicomonas sp. OPT23]MRI31468.1 hypothetical protein [Endozoicomonas sp. OPT23]
MLNISHKNGFNLVRILKVILFFIPTAYGQLSELPLDATSSFSTFLQPDKDVSTTQLEWLSTASLGTYSSLSADDATGMLKLSIEASSNCFETTPQKIACYQSGSITSTSVSIDSIQTSYQLNLQGSEEQPWILHIQTDSSATPVYMVKFGAEDTISLTPELSLPDLLTLVDPTLAELLEKIRKSGNPAMQKRWQNQLSKWQDEEKDLMLSLLVKKKKSGEFYSKISTFDTPPENTVKQHLTSELAHRHSYMEDSQEGEPDKDEHSKTLTSIKLKADLSLNNLMILYIPDRTKSSEVAEGGLTDDGGEKSTSTNDESTPSQGKPSVSENQNSYAEIQQHSSWSTLSTWVSSAASCLMDPKKCSWLPNSQHETSVQQLSSNPFSDHPLESLDAYEPVGASPKPEVPPVNQKTSPVTALSLPLPPSDPDLYYTHCPERNPEQPLNGCWTTYDPETKEPVSKVAIECNNERCRAWVGKILRDQDRGTCTSCARYLGREPDTEGLIVAGNLKPDAKKPGVATGTLLSSSSNPMYIGFYSSNWKVVGNTLKLYAYWGFMGQERIWTRSDDQKSPILRCRLEDKDAEKFR